MHRQKRDKFIGIARDDDAEKLEKRLRAKAVSIVCRKTPLNPQLGGNQMKALQEVKLKMVKS